MKISEIKPGDKLRVYHAARNRRRPGRWDNVTIVARLSGRWFRVYHEQGDFVTEVEVRSIGPREFKHETEARLRQEARDAAQKRSES